MKVAVLFTECFSFACRKSNSRSIEEDSAYLRKVL